MGPPIGMQQQMHLNMRPPVNMGPPHSSNLLLPPTNSSGGNTTSGYPSLYMNMNMNMNNDGADIYDNSITTLSDGHMGSNQASSMTSSVTSIVTTGPDGAPIDEASQQSTLSNTSAASGDDHQLTTQKPRKGDMNAAYYSHPATPQSTVPSPGTASINSAHDDNGDINNPNWSRTPASPIVNSHITPPTETNRTKKSDNLAKLYEMDDDPERRLWLKKLIDFMDERRTPITTCPIMSKQPVDLYRVYQCVKQRGGFVEVCKAAKNKTWKDVINSLGIPSSSGTANSLKKLYMKAILPFECHFDLGGIDPIPIINQFDTNSKKKSAKTASVPSPAGSSNSQDSFSGTNAVQAPNMDNYSNYNYPPGSSPDYNNIPSSANNSGAQNSLMNMQASSHNNYGSPANYNHYPNVQAPSGQPTSDQYQQYGGNSNYMPSNRSIFPMYPTDNDRSYVNNMNNTSTSTAASNSNNMPQDSYRYNYPQQMRLGYMPPNSTTNQQSSMYPPQQDYYRNDQNYIGQHPPTPGNMYSNGQINKNMHPPSPQQQRRHPDFTKEPQQLSIPLSQPQTQSQQQQQPPPQPPSQQQQSHPSLQQPQASTSPQQSLQQPQQSQPQTQTQPQQHSPQPHPPPPQSPNQSQTSSSQPQHHPPPQVSPQQQPPPPSQSPIQSQSSSQPVQQQTFPNYNQQRPQPYAWPNNNVPPYRGQYPQQTCSTNNQWNQSTLQPPPNQPPRPPSNSSANTVSPLQPQPPSQSQPPVTAVAATPGPVWDRYSPNSNVSNYHTNNYPPQPVIPTQLQPPLPPTQLQQQQQSLPPTQNSWGPQLPPTPKTTGTSGNSASTVPTGTGATTVLPPTSLQPPPPIPPIPPISSSSPVALTTPNSNQSNLLRPPINQRPQVYRSDKSLVTPSMFMKNSGSSSLPMSSYPSTHLPKRDITFPSDCVESITPVLSRRRKLNKNDVGPVDPWRILMGLKSGLLSESTWALDALNIFLYDDNSVSYFNLNSLPSLLETLLECFDTTLHDIFHESEIAKWHEKCTEENQLVDLGAIHDDDIDFDDRTTVSNHVPNYTSVTRNKKSIVKFVPQDEIFINDNHKNWDKFGDVINYYDNNDRFCRNFVQFRTDDSCSPDFIATNMNSDVKVNAVFCQNVEICQKYLDDDQVANYDDNSLSVKKENEMEIDSICVSMSININVCNSNSNSNTNSNNCNCTCNCNCNKHVNSNNFNQFECDYEDESYTRDEPSLCLISEYNDAVAKRGLCLSNILRNLSFVPGNEAFFALNELFLSITGKLLLLHHYHAKKSSKSKNYDRDDETDLIDSSCSSLMAEKEWWWEYLIMIRENLFVALANIAGYIDLRKFNEIIVLPIYDGLLHWAICPSSQAQDSFAIYANSLLTPQKLALECLCKLCVTEINVDLLIATPPFSRLKHFCALLTKLLCRSEEQILREFSINLLYFLSSAHSKMAKLIAMEKSTIVLLISFIELAEQSALSVANQHGIGTLRENPEMIGTSLDMLKRAAYTLLNLAKHPDNKFIFVQHEFRLLSLSMNQILDSQVSNIIAHILYELSH